MSKPTISLAAVNIRASTLTVSEQNVTLGISGTLHPNNLSGLVFAGFDGTLSLTDNNRDISLTVTPAPEPASGALLATGLALAMGTRRRRIANASHKS